MSNKIKIVIFIVALGSIHYSCKKKHACDCRYPNGDPYNIIESSNGDCSEWNEPKNGVTCKVVD
jgi:hypothetical protein